MLFMREEAIHIMNIKQIRLSKNMTQKQLADAIGVDHTMISKYEKGLVSPPSDRLEAMSKVLGVNIDHLVSNEDGIKLYVESRRRARNDSLNADMYFRSTETMVKRLISYNNGQCELCGQPAPFQRKDNTPYLEAHYVKWLSKGGSPTIDNLVVLCPNCHSRVHELNDPEDTRKLQEIIKHRNLN